MTLHLTVDDIACALGVSPAYCGGETPVRMLDTEVGADAVTESLTVIAYGGLS